MEHLNNRAGILCIPTSGLALPYFAFHRSGSSGPSISSHLLIPREARDSGIGKNSKEEII